MKILRTVSPIFIVFGIISTIALTREAHPQSTLFFTQKTDSQCDLSVLILPSKKVKKIASLKDCPKEVFFDLRAKQMIYADDNELISVSWPDGENRKVYSEFLDHRGIQRFWFSEQTGRLKVFQFIPLDGVSVIHKKDRLESLKTPSIPPGRRIIELNDKKVKIKTEDENVSQLMGVIRVSESTTNGKWKELFVSLAHLNPNGIFDDSYDFISGLEDKVKESVISLYDEKPDTESLEGLLHNALSLTSCIRQEPSDSALKWINQKFPPNDAHSENPFNPWAYCAFNKKDGIIFSIRPRSEFVHHYFAPPVYFCKNNCTKTEQIQIKDEAITITKMNEYILLAHEGDNLHPKIFSKESATPLQGLPEMTSGVWVPTLNDMKNKR